MTNPMTDRARVMEVLAKVLAQLESERYYGAAQSVESLLADLQAEAGGEKVVVLEPVACWCGQIHDCGEGLHVGPKAKTLAAPSAPEGE